MTGIEFALWGAAGSFAVDGLEVTTEVKKINGWPWGRDGYPSVAAALAAVVIRLIISAIVAAASGLSGTVNGVIGALAAGVAAPLIIEKLGKSVVATGASSSAIHSGVGAVPQHEAKQGDRA